MTPPTHVWEFPAYAGRGILRVPFFDTATLNISYHCPRCGFVWARRYHATRKLPFITYPTECPACDGGLLLTRGGANPDMYSDLKHVPREVLLREVCILGDMYKSDRFTLWPANYFPLAKESFA